MGESDLEFPQPSTIASLALKVYGRAKQCVINIPACENLSQLLYGLVDVLQLYSDHGLMADNQNAQHMMYEMQEQLEMAMRGIERVSMMPSMYRSINALRITTEFRNFCHSLGLTLEGKAQLGCSCCSVNNAIPDQHIKHCNLLVTILFAPKTFMYSRAQQPLLLYDYSVIFEVGIVF